MEQQANSLYHQANAKFVWGEDPNDIKKHLLQHGMGQSAAEALLAGFVKEKMATIKAKGRQRIQIGAGLLLLPLALYLADPNDLNMRNKLGYLLTGLFGVGQLISGLMMVFSPQNIRDGD